MSSSLPLPSEPPAPRKAVIIGVGLLGGSVGLGLRRRWPSLQVIGTSRTAETRQAAVSAGCVTEASEDEKAACQDADLVFVCTPVGMIAEKVIQVAGCLPERALITDVGSTKQKIVQRIEQDARARDKFVGSHPIAGGEQTGPQHARADLFHGKRVVITPTEHSDSERVDRLCQLWQLLGAQVLTLSPAVHDQRLAGISHATHFAACAIASILQPDEVPLVGSGWRDTTRVAAGDPRMWSDIACQNSAAIVERLRTVQQQLDALIDAIGAQDQATLLQLLGETQRLRRSVANVSDISNGSNISKVSEADSDA